MRGAPNSDVELVVLQYLPLYKTAASRLGWPLLQACWEDELRQSNDSMKCRDIECYCCYSHLHSSKGQGKGPPGILSRAFHNDNSEGSDQGTLQTGQPPDIEVTERRPFSKHFPGFSNNGEPCHAAPSLESLHLAAQQISSRVCGTV